MKIKTKNVKISEQHHDIIKKYCEKNGFKIHKILEKLIDGLNKPIKKDIYGEN
jgi:hypothetical protein